MSNTTPKTTVKPVHEGILNLRMRQDSITGAASTEYYVKAKGREYLIQDDKQDFGTQEHLRRAATEDRRVYFTVDQDAALAASSPYAGVADENITLISKYREKEYTPTNTFEGIVRLRRTDDPVSGKTKVEYYITTNPNYPNQGNFRIHNDDLATEHRNYVIAEDSRPLVFGAGKKTHACFTVSEEVQTDDFYEGWVERGSLKILKGQNQGKGSQER
jgi:hypothetical protein